MNRVFFFGSYALLSLFSFAIVSLESPALALCQQIPTINLPDDAPTRADHLKFRLQFRMDELTKYRELSADSPETKKVIEPFLELSISRETDRIVDLESEKAELAKLAKAALETGSTDPIYLSHAAMWLYGETEFHKAVDFGLRSTKQFESSETYSGAIKFISHGRLCEMRITSPVYLDSWMRVHKKWRDKALRDLPEYLAYGSKLPNGQRETFFFMERAISWCHFDKIETVASLDEIMERYGQREDKDPWLYEMGKGECADKLAWKYRGGGLAGSVAESGWKKFSELSKVAAEHFRAAHKLHPEFPEAATEMISIAGVGHAEKSKWHWFEQAVAAEVDHRLAYFYMINYLKPRWGGSIQQMLEFGRQCDATGRFDTMVPFYLVEVALNIEAREDVSWEQLFEQRAIYRNIMATCDSLVVDGNRSEYQLSQILTAQVCFAIAANEPEDTAALWRKIGERPLNQAMLKRFKLQVQYDRARCLAYLEFEKELAEVDPLIGEMRLDPENRERLLDVYQGCLRKTNNRSAARYLKHWIRILEMERDFEEGKWVELKFNRYHDDWRVLSDWIYHPEDRSVSLKSKGLGWRYLAHRGLFPGPKEIHAEVATFERTTRAYSMAIFIGDREDATRFWSDSSRQTIGNGNGWTDGWWGTAGPISKERNQIRTKFWNAKSYELWVDGFRYTINQGPRTDPPSDRHIGVGLFAPDSTTGHGAIYSARIRKITDPPLPRLLEHSKRIKYFSELIKKNPKKDFYRFERGREYYFTNQPQKAIADFALASKRSPQEHDYHAYFGDLLVRSGQVEKGLAELERSQDAYPASWFLGQSLLAFHLATAKDDSIRDVQRAQEIIDTIHAKSMPTLESTLALAAVQVEQGEIDKAIQSMKRFPFLDFNIAPHQKMYLPQRYADAKLVAEKIIEKKGDYSFTPIPLKGEPKTSTRASGKAGIAATTNDPFVYRPDTADFNFPALTSSGAKPSGYIVKGNPKAVTLNYQVTGGHVVTKEQPVVVVDLYGRRLVRKFVSHDNNISVIVFDGKKEIARRTSLAIPDDASPYVRCVFDGLDPGTKVTNVKVVANRSKDQKKLLFSLQEIRAAAIAPSETKQQ